MLKKILEKFGSLPGSAYLCIRFQGTTPWGDKGKSSLKGLKTRDREYMEHSGTATPRANGA